MPSANRLAIWLAVLFLGFGRPAWPQQASDLGPYLQVTTGQHTATINGLALLPDGHTLASVSDDKTARLWSSDMLEPQSIIRPPIGPQDEGKLYAVATGHNVIAVGGEIPDGHRLFAVQFYCPARKLRFCGSITELAVVRALRFSPDGKYLAIGFEGGAGILVFDVSSGTMTLADMHVSRGMTITPKVRIDSGYTSDVTWLDFDRQDRLLVTAGGKLRLYRTVRPAMAAEAAPLQSTANLSVRSAMFSPDGTRIAAGDLTRDVVHMIDGTSLRPGSELHGTVGRQGALDVVAWSPDGQTLYAAGTYKDASGNYLVRRWAPNGTSVDDTAAAGNTIMSLLPNADGVIFASADPAIGQIDQVGHLIAAQRPQLIDFRNIAQATLGVSHDGGVVEFQNGDPQQRLRIDINQRLITAVAEPSAKLPRPQESSAGLVVTDWRNQRTPRVNGRLLTLDPTETAHAAAVSPTGNGVAIGTDFYLRFETAGAELWKVPTPAPVWGANISGDGRLIVAALGDGTLRWYDVATHQERLGLFVDPTPHGPGGLRWVMWTPQGYFDHDHRSDGAADGRNLIGYLIDSPDWKTTQFVQIGQMYSTFFRPDLVDMSFRGGIDDLNQIKQQGTLHLNVQQIIAQGLPATVTMLDMCGHDLANQDSGCPTGSTPGDLRRPTDLPGIDLATSEDTAIVRYRIDARDDHIGSTIIKRNGAVIRPDIFVDEENAKSRTEEATVPLGAGTNAIEIIPVSPSGDVQGTGNDVVQVKIQHTPATRGGTVSAAAPSAPSATAPVHAEATLYMLSVGISAYDQSALRLANAAHDAQAVAQLMDAPDPPVYTGHVVKPLLDSNATTANITAALKDIAVHAKPDDLVIIFLAGHGEQVNGKYYFAPAEFGTHDPALFQRAMNLGNSTADRAVDTLFQQEGLGQAQLLPLIQSISAAHVALILDTCFSAAIATQDAVLRRDLNTTVADQIGNSVGRFVLSSAMNLALDTGSASTTDLPVDQQGHGLFTSYLLQALQGKADFLHSGRVDIDDLAKYTQHNVEQATATMPQPQQPTFYFSGNDFFALRGVLE